jgi:hypothetical protein
MGGGAVESTSFRRYRDGFEKSIENAMPLNNIIIVVIIFVIGVLWGGYVVYLSSCMSGYI